MPWGLFISYRREDSADVTGRIYDHLVASFGEAAVFKDVDSIPLGVDFRTHLQSVVGQCRVVLVVIGRGWAEARVGDGGRRIDLADDFVRLEIEAALSRGVAVVPLLVQGATMPAPDELPEPIRPLAFRQGTPIKRDPDFRADVERLVRGRPGARRGASRGRSPHRPPFARAAAPEGPQGRDRLMAEIE